MSAKFWLMFTITSRNLEKLINIFIFSHRCFQASRTESHRYSGDMKWAESSRVEDSGFLRSPLFWKISHGCRNRYFKKRASTPWSDMFSSHSHLLLIHENIDIANKLRSLLPLQCALVTDRIHTVRFCFRKLGRIEEALEDYNDAIRCSPLLKWYHGASCWPPQLLTRAKVPTSSAAVIAESWNRDTFRGRISAAPATIARVASNILIILQEFLSEIDYNCGIIWNFLSEMFRTSHRIEKGILSA